MVFGYVCRLCSMANPLPPPYCSLHNTCFSCETPTYNLHCCHFAQMNLLVLHEAFSPSTSRLIREAAALMSSQSVAMPVQKAEHVTPITSSSGAEQPKALFASILQLANTGALPMVLTAPWALPAVVGMQSCRAAACL
jgi:hypothetical protein